MSSTLKRKIFFWFFVLMFLITAPVIILYSIGYRFSLERNIFIHSGSITVKPIPQRVDIFIDNKPVSSNKINFLNYTYHLDGIKPGEHIIKITKDGYQPWSKKTIVQSGLSTEFWNIFLAQNNYSRNSFDLGEIDNYFISPKDNRIAITQEKEGGLKIIILNTDDQTIESNQLFDDYLLNNNKKENIEWSPQGNKLIIPVIKKDTKEKDYLITDIEFKKQLSLKNFIKKENLKNARWDPLYKDWIFFISQDNLFRINLNQKSSIKTIKKNVSGFDISKSGVYYLESLSGIIQKKSLEGENEKQITMKPIKDIIEKNLRLIVYDKERIAVLNGDKTFYLYNEGEKNTYMNKLPGKVNGIQFSNDGKKVLYWTDREIFVHFLRYWDTQPIREENVTHSVTRFSQKISNVHWHEDYEHIIFNAGKKIKITEIDNRSYRNTMDLIELNTDETKMVSNFSENWLLFLDSEDQKTKLKLSYIDFLEKED